MRKLLRLLPFALLLLPALAGAEPGAAPSSASETPRSDEAKKVESDTAFDSETKSKQSTDAPAASVERKPDQKAISTSTAGTDAASTRKVDEELSTLDHEGLLARAEEVSQELSDIDSLLEIPEELTALKQELAKEEALLAASAEAARREISAASRWFLISDIQFAFRGHLLELKAKRGPLDQFSQVIGPAPKRVDEILAEWTHTRSVLKKVGASTTVLERVDRLLRSAQLLQLRLNRLETVIARTGAQFDRMNAKIQGLLQQSETAAPSLLRDFSHRNASSAEGALVSVSSTWEASAAVIKAHRRSIAEFSKVSIARLFFHLILFCVLALLLIKCRSFYRDGAGEEVAQQHLILRHPWAGALLIAMILTTQIHPVAPAVVLLIAITLAVLASSILILDRESKDSRVLIVGSWVLVLLLSAHMFLTRVPRVEQWFVGLEGVVVLLLTLQFPRSSVLRWQGVWRGIAVVVTRLWIVAVIVGLICWFAGFDRSSSILIDGTARLLLISLVLRVCYEVLASIIVLGAQSPWAMRLRIFERHGALITERVKFVLRWALAFYWARTALRAYALQGQAVSAYQQIVEKEVSVGSITLQFSSVLLLIAGIALAVYSSRLTRFVLEEDILSRTAMSVGSQAALTFSAGYVVLGFGLFTTLAAVGFQLDKIAILVSALGVGIGFGLQNIVQNFVAGVILIFGRPINVGDRVQVGDLFGMVSEIGFRASTVRTIQGAEVIVPNSQFVADQVINWSLSDNRRRVEVDVGVKYGTEPERVLAILIRVAEDHPSVLADPPPEALFMAFGASSLDFQLRGWTADGGNWMLIRSDLSIAIDKAFKEAEIEIPFPQRDLNLRSVDAEAVRAWASAQLREKP